MAVMRYEVRVAGRMSELASSAFRGMTVAPVAPETIICGEVADDAHLHGLLERCQNMGLQVVSVREAPSVALATGGSSLDRPRPALEWYRHTPDDIIDGNISGSRHHLCDRQGPQRCEEQDMSIEEG